MKLTCVKSGLLFFFVSFLFVSCAVTPKGPADDRITSDWNAFIKANSAKFCVSLNKFEILEKTQDKMEYDVTVKISGEWNCQDDTITVNGPLNLFLKSKGKDQSVEFKMVYVKENEDWILKGFITK